jgi:hypothetical protein
MYVALRRFGAGGHLRDHGVAEMKPVCASCELDMKPLKNGAYVEYMASFGPYKIHQADLWQCQCCGAKVLVGIGATAIAEHFQDNYAELREDLATESLMIRCWENIEQKIANEEEMLKSL